MKPVLAFLFVSAMVDVGTSDIMDQLKQLETQLHQFEAKIKQSIGDIARQMMAQQLFVEERIRSDGNSGVKQIRATGGGTKPYHYYTFASTGAFLSVHEHSNYDRTVGLGEFVAVLNGVEFRTRHNDYRLSMPSLTKKDYHAVENVPFPDVPPSVLSKKTVHEQVVEMQQYFKAFHTQNKQLRNYEPYFKPVLCYLEGAWTTETQSLVEPFASDRHFIDATSWYDLQQKIMYTSATGGKSQFENFSYLPTTIVNVTDDGTPVYAQWNYRILCHPIKHPLQLKDIRPVDDLASRMNSDKNFTDYARNYKQVRFTIAPNGGKDYHAEDCYGDFTDTKYMHSDLDTIMYEIPGVDNYPANLYDTSFGRLKYRVDTKNNTVLNTGRYHRQYKVLEKGDDGLTVRNRGYSDGSLWVAQTTSPKIAKMSAEDCHQDSHSHQMVCTTYEARTTYAVPLEIVWLTPLSAWNPYNLHIETNSRNLHFVTDNGRNGGLNQTTAFNGTGTDNYYLTPAEFYHGGESERDPADTAKDVVGVLDQHGQVQQVSAAGVRIFTPDIPGVGKVRIRYPIAPVHQEGSAEWKNLIALQDIMMNVKKYTNMFEEKPEIKDLNAHPQDTRYMTSTTHANPPGMHSHSLYLTDEEMKALLLHGTTVSVYTTENNGHQHQLELKMDPSRNGTLSQLLIVSCDGMDNCWDAHTNIVYKH